MILKDYFPELKEVKFSDRLLNFFELLCSHDRADLASKMVIELSLHKGYDEKQSFLRQEIDSTIHHIKELTDRTLQYALMETIEKNSTPVDYYAELFKDILKKGLQLITEDEKIYKESVNAIENLLNASEKNKFRALAYGDLLVRKDELLKTPKIKPVAEILLYLHHLDLLYLNLKAIENGEGILTNNFKDSSTKIREFFDAMDPDKNEWESVFKSEKDYDTFCHLLTCYYDNKKYELPSEKIEMEPNMKGKIGLVLGTIHLEFKGTYICNEEYCKIINVLKPFKDKKRPQVYDIIRR